MLSLLFLFVTFAGSAMWSSIRLGGQIKQVGAATDNFHMDLLSSSGGEASRSDRKSSVESKRGYGSAGGSRRSSESSSTGSADGSADGSALGSVDEA